jgi:hypothetical protein
VTRRCGGAAARGAVGKARPDSYVVQSFSVRFQLSTAEAQKLAPSLTFDFLVNKFGPGAFQSRSQLSKKLPSSDLFLWMDGTCSRFVFMTADRSVASMKA